MVDHRLWILIQSYLSVVWSEIQGFDQVLADVSYNKILHFQQWCILNPPEKWQVKIVFVVEIIEH